MSRLPKREMDDAYLEEMFSRYTMPVTECGCLLWIGQVNQDGYGRIVRDEIKGHSSRAREAAHRVAWKRANKQSIPIGMFVCHTCDVPCCVNPDHLFLGTPQDNAQDMARKGRNSMRDCVTKRLTIEDVIAIRGSQQRDVDLARHYGVTRQAVYFARIGRTWGHLPTA